MRRPLMVFSLIAALLSFVPMAALAQGTPEAVGASGRTDTRLVVPFGPDGLNTGLTVSETVQGACDPDSIAVPDRPDAWACTGENNKIYDPCFENSFVPPDQPAELACFTDPFSKTVAVVKLDAPLSRTKGPSAQGPLASWDLPWAVELANGDRCMLLNDIEVAIAGESVYYGCANGGTILGQLDRSQPVWTVNYVAKGAVTSGLVDVTVAWS